VYFQDPVSDPEGMTNIRSRFPVTLAEPLEKSEASWREWQFDFSDRFHGVN
jgi:hypothetical protein